VRISGTLLQIATFEHGKEDFAKMLLDFGVDPMGICQEKAETPMEIALDRHNKEVFKMLEEVAEIPDKIKLIQLKKIIQSEKTSKREKDKFQTILGSLPVDLASTAEVREKTLLQHAISSQRVDYARTLLEFGVDPNITCKNCKSTPLEIAALYLDHTSSSEELLCLLGEYTEMPDDIKFVYLKKMIDGSLVNPGEFEKTLGSLKIDMVNASVRYWGTWHGRVEKCGTLLQYAVKGEQIDVVQILLQFGADPNAVTEEEEATPVEIALEKKNPHLIIKLAQYTEISKGMKLDLLRLLLEKNEEDQDDHENFKSNLKGLSVSEVLGKQLSGENISDEVLQWTGPVNMLQFAAAKGKTEILQLLLNHGVGPDGNGDSPSAIDFAASCGRVEAFAFLAERLGAGQDSDWFGLRQLLVWGWSIYGDEVTNRHNWKPSEEFQCLLSKLPLTKVSNEAVCGSTLLQSFCWVGNRAAVALLLQQGVNPSATTAKNPKLPERLAFEFSHVGVLAELAKIKVLDPEILSSSLGQLVQKEEEMEWQRRRLEEMRLHREALDKCTSAVHQQQEWQKELVEVLKEQNKVISILAKKLYEAGQE